MASSCNPRFLIPRLSLQLLFLTMTWHSAVTESTDPIPLRGEVGGTVEFHCPVDKKKKKDLAMLYLQKGDLFVNGYYAIRDLPDTWENTRVDDNMTIVMHKLNVSHSGDYRCIIRYNGESASERNLRLYVTANYSKPSISVHCSDQNHPFSCLVQCTSHGGYPSSEATWHIPGSSKVVNNSKMRDPVTETFNISSIANINCSDGNLTSFSCSVDNVISDIVSVCTKDPLDTQSPYVMAAAILAVVFIIVVALVWWRSCKKGQRRAAAEAVRRANGFEEEVIVFSETQRPLKG